MHRQQRGEDMKATPQQLKKLPFFQSLTDEELTKAIQCLDLNTMDVKGKKQLQLSLFKDKIALLLSGQLFIEKNSAEGDLFIVSTLAPGDLIWNEQLGLSDEHIIQVKSDTKLLVFEQAIFPEGCALRTYIYQQLLKHVLEQHQRLFERVDLLGNRRLRERILSFLEKQGAEAGKTITIPYSRHELAHYLHVDRSALSRELTAMKQDGLLDYHLNSFTLSD